MAKFVNVKKDGEEAAMVNVDYIMSVTPNETGCTIVVYPGDKDGTIELDISMPVLMGRIGS